MMSDNELHDKAIKAAERLFGSDGGDGLKGGNVMRVRPAFSERMLSFAGKMLGERAQVAQVIMDKVAEAAEVYLDNGYSGEAIGRIARAAALEAIEVRARESGLLGDPRD